MNLVRDYLAFDATQLATFLQRETDFLGAYVSHGAADRAYLSH
jgi:hypothetical protein